MSKAKSKPKAKSPTKAKGSAARAPAKVAAPAKASKAKASAPKVAAKKTAPAAKSAAKAGKAAVTKVLAAASKKAAATPPAKVFTKAANKPTGSTKKEKPVSAAGDKKKSAEIVLDPNYRPAEDEPFMNERQRVYFRNKLRTWKEEIIRQTRETLAGLHEDSTQHADLADRATSETDRALELRARDRQRKLIAKIDAALARIEDGSYGYCEETGEPIGLKRLDARPIATLSLEAQERHERREKVYRED